MAREDFREHCVVKSEKQQLLDEDNAKYEDMEALRSQLAAVDPSVFSQLFPGLILRHPPLPLKPLESKRKQVVTNGAIVAKKPKIVVDDFGCIVEDNLPDDITEDLDCDSPIANPDEDPTEDYARSDETSSSSGSSEGHSS